jgi:hypothetical protein
MRRIANYGVAAPQPSRLPSESFPRSGTLTGGGLGRLRSGHELGQLAEEAPYGTAVLVGVVRRTPFFRFPSALDHHAEAADACAD